MLNPSRYRILAIGKVHKLSIRQSINQYATRLPGLTITELRDSSFTKESQLIQSSLGKNEKLIALSEDGETLSSVEFASRLSDLGSQRLAFAIGGAHGLTAEVKNKSFWRLSLSPLTFPHEIARLLLIEQIYRAQTIIQGGPYHRQ